MEEWHCNEDNWKPAVSAYYTRLLIAVVTFTE